MVVGNRCVLEQIPVKCFPHSRLSNAVEVNIVLSNKLIYRSVVSAPPVMPVTRGVTSLWRFCEDCLNKWDWCPKALWPAPNRKIWKAFKFGSGNTPINIACNTERKQGFTRAEPHVMSFQDSTSLVSLAPVVKFNWEGLLISCWLLYDMFRQLMFTRAECFTEFFLNVDHGLSKWFAYRFRNNSADLRILFPCFNNLFNICFKSRQVEIPVIHRTELRSSSG